MRKRLLSVGIVLAVLAAAVTWALWPADPGFTTHDERIEVLSGPDGDDAVTLDARLYLPDEASASHQVPAVLLGHGFGATLESVVSDAEELTGQGYAVLTWTARGFGASTGQIHLNAPEYEVRDAQQLLDWLAQRPEVQLDSPGDPRVGVLGGSYGGALALLLAGYDQRVDAIVPMITWNQLGNALFPGGVFKKAWAGIFFSSGVGRGGPSTEATSNPGCGRWAPDVCQTYLRIAAAGALDAEAAAMLASRSPASVLSRITAPTLLIQGGADSLFPLSEADANAAGIAAGSAAPVRVAWFTGGHDGGAGPQADEERLKLLTGQWLAHYLKGEGETPAASFTYSRISGLDPVERGRLATGYRLDSYPGLDGTDQIRVGISGPAQPVANPPNGTPAAISALPQAGALASFVDGVVTDLPGQHASWRSAELAESLQVAGSPTVTFRAASPTGEAVLFVKLYDVAADGTAALSNGLVAPIKLAGLPGDISQARPITIRLPAIVREIEAGHHLRVTIATADQAYLGPAAPVTYTVQAEGEVVLPVLPATPIPTSSTLWWYALGGLLVLLIGGTITAVAVARRRHRRADRTISQAYGEIPLHVAGLRKTYGDFVAVDRIDFTVRRGEVVGLLGPNGAGKTTSLRVLMGMIQATAGEALIFGHRLAPGAPVLSRIGALVEGPGFLPHLTGEQNLRAYWRATGRPPGDARLDEALEIAGLGEAIHRRVKDYSHGMKQRLAVAQAMLGLPELLILDEPTDGLDPPQIAEMRRVLQRYAVDGRAVLVSSHLLAEVEQTCTHVVVLDKGRVVAAGRVAEIVGDTPTTIFEVSDVDLAQRALDRLEVSYAADTERTLIAELGDVSRADAVAAMVRAGVGVYRVVPRRKLEDAFLALVGTSTAGSGDR